MKKTYLSSKHLSNVALKSPFKILEEGFLSWNCSRLILNKFPFICLQRILHLTVKVRKKK